MTCHGHGPMQHHYLPPYFINTSKSLFPKIVDYRDITHASPRSPNGPVPTWCFSKMLTPLKVLKVKRSKGHTSSLESPFFGGTVRTPLVGGFKDFLFSPLPGEMIQFD